MASRIKVGVGTRALSTAKPTEQFRQIQRNLQKVIDGVVGATPDIVRASLKPIFDESQILVPKDTLELMRSGYLVVKTQGKRIVGEVGYARGGKPHYGIIVHEDLEAHHDAPTQAKYLQHAVNSKISQTRRILTTRYRQLLNG